MTTQIKPRWRRITLAMLGLLVLSCGNRTDGSDVVATGGIADSTAQPSRVSVENPPENWKDQGEKIIADKATWPTDSLMKQYAPINAGAFAYQSEPVTIEGPGTYELKFNITGEFSGTGFTYMAPPDATFQYSILPPPELATRGVYTVKLIVPEGQDVRYAGFSMWIY